LLVNTIVISFQGIWVSSFSETQLASLKRRRNIVLPIGKVTVPTSMQEEMIRFLSLYYSEGENLYGLLVKYQQVVDKKTRKIVKMLLYKLRQGEDFCEVILSERLFCAEVRPLFLAARAQGLSKEKLLAMSVILKNKQKDKKELIKKAIYPALLVCMSMSMLVFVSYNVIPSFSVFFQDSGKQVPFLLKVLSRQNVWKLLLGLIFIVMLVCFFFKWLKPQIKVKIPLYRQKIAAVFQEIFWRINLVAVETGISVEELLDDYLQQDKKSIEGFYLSTIHSRLKRGLSMEEAIDVLLIDKKQKALLGMGTDQERKKLLYYSFLEEIEERNQQYQGLIVNIISGAAMLFIAGLVLLLGYVLLIPLSQISNFI